MTSLINYADDKDLDDAALWAVIDSAAAASISSATETRKPLPLNHSSPIPKSNPSPHVKFPKYHRNHHRDADGEVLQNYGPNKVARSNTTTTPCISGMSHRNSPPLALVTHVQRTPTAPVYNSPETRSFTVTDYNSPIGAECSPVSCRQFEDTPKHSLSGRFPTVSLFKEYQNAAMAILEKSDYTMISGSPYIKKSGWRKISFYFNVSYEIRDKTIEFDEGRNVLHAEFVVRAHMQGSRFSDGWGSCERREKRFLKPNHDIPIPKHSRDQSQKQSVPGPARNRRVSPRRCPCSAIGVWFRALCSNEQLLRKPKAERFL